MLPPSCLADSDHITPIGDEDNIGFDAAVLHYNMEVDHDYTHVVINVTVPDKFTRVFISYDGESRDPSFCPRVSRIMMQ